MFCWCSLLAWLLLRMRSWGVLANIDSCRTLWPLLYKLSNLWQETAPTQKTSIYVHKLDNINTNKKYTHIKSPKKHPNLIFLIPSKPTHITLIKTILIQLHTQIAIQFRFNINQFLQFPTFGTVFFIQFP